MKRTALGLLLLVLAAGCGSGSHPARTQLRVTALNTWVGMAIFHLDCSPTGGDVADPAAACAALAHDAKLVTSPTPYVCIGGPTSWFDLTISGRLAGQPVHRKFSTCWTPQSATLDKLGLASTLERHVRHRRQGLVAAGQTRTFPVGALRPGDLLLCGAPGRELKLGIPARIGPLGSTSSGGLLGATLTGTRHPDGSVTAICRPRSA